MNRKITLSDGDIERLAKLRTQWQGLSGQIDAAVDDKVKRSQIDALIDERDDVAYEIARLVMDIQIVEPDEIPVTTAIGDVASRHIAQQVRENRRIMTTLAGQIDSIMANPPLDLDKASAELNHIMDHMQRSTARPVSIPKRTAECPICGADWPEHMAVTIDAAVYMTATEAYVSAYDERTVSCGKCGYDEADNAYAKVKLSDEARHAADNCDHGQPLIWGS